MENTLHREHERRRSPRFFHKKNRVLHFIFLHLTNVGLVMLNLIATRKAALSMLYIAHKKCTATCVCVSGQSVRALFQKDIFNSDFQSYLHLHMTLNTSRLVNSINVITHREPVRSVPKQKRSAPHEFVPFLAKSILA